MPNKKASNTSDPIKEPTESGEPHTPLVGDSEEVSAYVKLFAAEHGGRAGVSPKPAGEERFQGRGVKLRR